MANKFYSQFSDRKITSPVPPKDSRGGITPSYSESVHSYGSTNLGSAGPSRNKVGFKEVKQYAQQHLADDKWIQKAIKHPGAFTKSAKKAGKSVAAYAEEKKGAPGVLGKRARLAQTLKKLGHK
jgi:hypothetical protein